MIVIIGATGLIGRALVKKLTIEKFEVAVITRNFEKARNKFEKSVKIVEIAQSDANEIISTVNGTQAIINLAGENISQGRWTRRKKQEILSSRVNSVKMLESVILRCKKKPATVIQASATGYYGDRGNEELTEKSHIGKGFLAKVCNAWEQTNIDYQKVGINHKTLRFGVVLSSNGGYLKKMLPMFKLGIGAVTGSGQNYIPWIHIDDLVNAIVFLLKNPAISGIFNVTSPHPVKNVIMSRTLGKTLHRPVLLKIPAFFLKIALGQFAKELILSSQKVFPSRLMEAGFQFTQPQLDEALQDLLNKK